MLAGLSFTVRTVGTGSVLPNPSAAGPSVAARFASLSNSDWSYGGLPVIGQPDINSYPLMKAIDQAKSLTAGTICLNFRTTSVNDNFYVCANGINDGRYAYNNLQQYDATCIQVREDRAYGDTSLVYVRTRSSHNWRPIQLETGANAAYCLLRLQNLRLHEFSPEV